jgi:hypothetical protein
LKVRHRSPVLRGVLIGTLANTFSTVALTVSSQLERGRPAAALNGPSQWVWGRLEARTRQATLRHTALGYGIHHAMSIGWAMTHSASRTLGRERLERTFARAAATAAVAYFVDYHVTPKRLRPGFRKHLSGRSIFAAYGAFALGLALGDVWLDRYTRH